MQAQPAVRLPRHRECGRTAATAMPWTTANALVSSLSTTLMLLRCGGKQPHAATPSHSNPIRLEGGSIRKPSSLEPVQEPARKVYIDRETEVPFELYMLLLEAGKNARGRGQHHKVRPCKRASGGSSGMAAKTHLVASEPVGEAPPERSSRAARRSSGATATSGTPLLPAA
mmetsp:Transcript_94620/g.264941  ORF Transcript_94620/g.264941 Transcript_94620/m.264941 type:complete len:171 (+) Transcript_94620:14-526(+)